MKKPTMFIAILAFAAASAAPTAASAGTAVDPNLNDVVLGTTGGVRYASDIATYDAGTGYAGVEAGCGGPTWHLIGGGAAGGGSQTSAWLESGQPVDYTDADTNTDDGWDGSGYGSAAAHITAYSICIRGTGLRYRSRTFTPTGSQLRTGSVTCGGNAWHATTGGAFIASSQSWANAAFPSDGSDPGTVPDDGWSGRVFDTNPGGSAAFIMHAVCAKGLQLTYVRRAPISLPASTAIVVRAVCPKGQPVIGGGARVTGPIDQARIATSAPFDGSDADAIPDDGWQVGVDNVSGGAKSVTAFAVCLA